MQCSDTAGKLPVVHIPDETIKLAQKIQRIESLIAEDTGGNGEIIIKLKVTSGKIGRFLQLAGKWFPWG